MMDTIVNIRYPEIYISYDFTDTTGQSKNKIKYKMKKYICFNFSIVIKI